MGSDRSDIDTIREGIGLLRSMQASGETSTSSSDWTVAQAITAIDRVAASLAEKDKQIAALEKERTLIYERWVAEEPSLAAEIREKDAQIERLTRELAGVRRWFHERPWVGAADGSLFGCGEVIGEYTPNERKLGYGTYRDPRFLPAALGVTDEGDDR